MVSSRFVFFSRNSPQRQNDASLRRKKTRTNREMEMTGVIQNLKRSVKLMICGPPSWWCSESHPAAAGKGPPDGTEPYITGPADTAHETVKYAFTKIGAMLVSYAKKKLFFMRLITENSLVYTHISEYFCLDFGPNSGKGFGPYFPNGFDSKIDFVFWTEKLGSVGDIEIVLAKK